MAHTHRNLLLIGGAMVVVVAAILAFRAGSERPATTVQIGYLPIYVDLPLFVAKESGLFAKHHVNVELTRFAASPDMGTALANGKLDIAASIATAVLLSSESRDPGKLKAFIVDSETPENYLSSIVVMPVSGIKSLDDLRGKKLGSFPGPTAVTFCKLVLEKAGLNPDKDLSIIELPVQSHLAALTSGQVDALFTYEPTGTQAVLQKGAHKLLPGAVESKIINPWQAGSWVIRDAFAREYPREARAIIMALYEAIDSLRANPSAAKAALIPYTTIDQSVAQATPNIPFAKVGEVNLDVLQQHADILQRHGIISKYIDVKQLLLSKSVLP